MPEIGTCQRLLDEAYVDDGVFALRPEYRALLVVAEGIVPGPSDETSDALLGEAAAFAMETLKGRKVEDLSHVSAWREAYRAFGAKPQRTRNSLEALVRRAESGLPRINRLTDIYNAISVLHQIPLGGEDLAGYSGPPRLMRATGDEPFETTADGTGVIEYPEPGEVVWCDDKGVTCRRWNWRQCRRTQLHGETTSALFIFDALDPLSTRKVHAAADDLIGRLGAFSPQLVTARRLISAGDGGPVRG